MWARDDLCDRLAGGVIAGGREDRGCQARGGAHGTPNHESGPIAIRVVSSEPSPQDRFQPCVHSGVPLGTGEGAVRSRVHVCTVRRRLRSWASGILGKSSRPISNLAKTFGKIQSRRICGRSKTLARISQSLLARLSEVAGRGISESIFPR